jgi:hypothetical protein
MRRPRIWFDLRLLYTRIRFDLRLLCTRIWFDLRLLCTRIRPPTEQPTATLADRASDRRGSGR